MFRHFLASLGGAGDREKSGRPGGRPFLLELGGASPFRRLAADVGKAARQ
jgi:hypothetical protein